MKIRLGKKRYYDREAPYGRFDDIDETPIDRDTYLFMKALDRYEILVVVAPLISLIPGIPEIVPFSMIGYAIYSFLESIFHCHVAFEKDLERW